MFHDTVNEKWEGKMKKKKKKKKEEIENKKKRDIGKIANDEGLQCNLFQGSFVSFHYGRTPHVNIGVIEIRHVADSNLISACN